MYLPERLSHRIESRKMDVLVKTTFTALAKDRTKMESKDEFHLPRHVPTTAQPFHAERAIRRRHHDDIQAFKRFAEAAR